MVAVATMSTATTDYGLRGELRAKTTVTVNPNCRPIIILRAKVGAVYRLGGVLREEVRLGK